MLDRTDLDAVMICTSWRTRVPAAVAALRSGRHAFLEVPAAITIEDCWQLVDTAEATRLHCMMMENCCYGRDELMVLNLCRQRSRLHGERKDLIENGNCIACAAEDDKVEQWIRQPSLALHPGKGFAGSHQHGTYRSRKSGEEAQRLPFFPCWFGSFSDDFFKCRSCSFRFG